MATATTTTSTSKFTFAMDEILRNALRTADPRKVKWEEVAKLFPEVSSKECKARWEAIRAFPGLHHMYFALAPSTTQQRSQRKTHSNTHSTVDNSDDNATNNNKRPGATGTASIRGDPYLNVGAVTLCVASIFITLYITCTGTRSSATTVPDRLKPSQQRIKDSQDSQQPQQLQDDDAELQRRKQEVADKLNSSIHKIRQTRSEEIVIHVCDEAKSINKDFKCDRHLLVNEMKYFQAYLNDSTSFEEIDISVHCDITIFQWLMNYINNDHQFTNTDTTDSTRTVTPDTSVDTPDTTCKLNLTNCISILISSHFLQMPTLIHSTLQYVHTHINQIIQSPIDLSCIHITLVEQLADMMIDTELETIVDKKDKLLSKLYMKKLESLLSLKHNYVYQCSKCQALYTVAHTHPHIYNSSTQDNNNHNNNKDNTNNNVSNNNNSNNNNISIHPYIQNKYNHTAIQCPHAKPYVDFYGNVIAEHIQDTNWNIKKYLLSLRAIHKYTWRQIYWHIWSHITTLYCTVCGQRYMACQLNMCSYHNSEPVYGVGDNTGYYPCCRSTAIRFHSFHQHTGCQTRPHVIDDDNLLDKRSYDIILKHMDVCLTPYSKIMNSIGNNSGNNSTNNSSISNNSSSNKTLQHTQSQTSIGGKSSKTAVNGKQKNNRPIRFLDYSSTSESGSIYNSNANTNSDTVTPSEEEHKQQSDDSDASGTDSDSDSDSSYSDSDSGSDSSSHITNKKPHSVKTNNKNTRISNKALRQLQDVLPLYGNHKEKILAAAGAIVDKSNKSKSGYATPFMSISTRTGSRINSGQPAPKKKKPKKVRSDSIDSTYSGVGESIEESTVNKRIWKVDAILDEDRRRMSTLVHKLTTLRAPTHSDPVNMQNHSIHMNIAAMNAVNSNGSMNKKHSTKRNSFIRS